MSSSIWEQSNDAPAGPPAQEPLARFAAVITAAGSSRRMGGVKKEYQVIGTDEVGAPLTVLGAAVRAFARTARIPLIAVSVPSGTETGEAAARAAIGTAADAIVSAASSAASSAKINLIFVPGGASRRSSVFHALCALVAYHPDYVLIHDGARPWLDGALLSRLMDAVPRYGAVLPVLPPVETPKELNPDGFVERHLQRARVGLAQTPQAFNFTKILQAHTRAHQEYLAAAADTTAPLEYTDDAEIWGKFEGAVKTISGSPANKKITFAEDLQNPPA